MGEEMKIIFEAKECCILKKNPKWVRVGFWKWLKLVNGGFTTRMRIQKKEKYIPPPELPL